MPKRVCSDASPDAAEVPLPYSGAAAAAALWAAPTATCTSACTAAPGAVYGSTVVSSGAAGPVQLRRDGNYGGLNREPAGAADTTVSYDPRMVSMRAPMAPEAPDGAVMTAPSLAHGPSAFFVGDGRTAPKTQYAPVGPIPMPEPLLLDVAHSGCVCSTVASAAALGLCRPVPYSLATLLRTPMNTIHVRDLLEAAGVVKVSPALAAQCPPPACVCAVFGGDADLVAGWLLFSATYEDTPVITTPNPVATVLFLDGVYLDRVLGDIRTEVMAGARANYARAEGPRACLQDLPAPQEAEAPPAPLPEVLPGTGCLTTPLDTPFAARNLTDPRSCAANRAAFATCTGLPLGTCPLFVPVTALEQAAVAAQMETEQCGRCPLPARSCPRLGKAPQAFVIDC